jgi:hypothetical protein
MKKRFSIKTPLYTAIAFSSVFSILHAAGYRGPFIGSIDETLAITETMALFFKTTIISFPILYFLRICGVNIDFFEKKD